MTAPSPASPLRWIAAIGMLVTLLAMAWFDASASLLNGFTLWVLAPCLVALVLSLLPARMRPRVLAWLVGVCLAAGPLVYVAASFAPRDANDALVFAVMPAWQLLGIVVACVVSAVVAWIVPRPR